jgi:hypothetical protein
MPGSQVRPADRQPRRSRPGLVPPRLVQHRSQFVGLGRVDALDESAQRGWPVGAGRERLPIRPAV